MTKSMGNSVVLKIVLLFFITLNHKHAVSEDKTIPSNTSLRLEKHISTNSNNSSNRIDNKDRKKKKNSWLVLTLKKGEQTSEAIHEQVEEQYRSTTKVPFKTTPNGQSGVNFKINREKANSTTQKITILLYVPGFSTHDAEDLVGEKRKEYFTNDPTTIANYDRTMDIESINVKAVKVKVQVTKYLLVLSLKTCSLITILQAIK